MASSDPIRLFILRHAHSLKATAGQSDRDRSLDQRGQADAARLADLLQSQGHRIDVVVFSTALRARQTQEIVRKGLRGDPDGEPDDALYEAGTDAYYAAAQRAVGGSSVMVVGHNPAIEEFTTTVCGNRVCGGARLLQRGFATCGLAIVEFPAGIETIGPGTGTLVDFMNPASLA